MNFHEVHRTWIYLREMDRDYAEFNRARREFFRSRDIELMPASTAVGGEPSAEAHDVSMRLYRREVAAAAEPGAHVDPHPQRSLDVRLGFFPRVEDG